MLAFYIFLCALAVFGFYCAVHILTEWIFAPEQVTVAIEIREKKDAEMLDMLLHEAASAFFRKGRSRIVILLSADLMDGTVGRGEDLYSEYREILDQYGAECYLIEPD